MALKKIPYGTSNFGTVKDNNAYYVDKTQFIEQLENLNEQYIFFLRPRKFGKSLFVSMLQYYYGAERKNKFEYLFGDTYIGAHPTPKTNTYCILLFDFSGIDTKDAHSTFIGFKENIFAGIASFNTQYKLFSTDELGVMHGKENPSEIMTIFFTTFENKETANKVYILVDEYDHFTNELMSFRIEEFKDIVSKNGYVRKFYEVIKTYTRNGIVDRLFATGVTPITLDSLTSGFNIASDMSLDHRLNDMMGFTEHEVKQMLEYYDLPDRETILADMKTYYNGSLFHREAKNRLYNSDMVLHFLKGFLSQGKYPENLIDNNIASDYNKIKKILNISTDQEIMDTLTEIIETSETIALLTTQFTFERDFTTNDFVSLLFYNGMLTIKESHFGRLKFQIPNYVIKVLYWGLFAEMVKRNVSSPHNYNHVATALENLAMFNDMHGWLEQIEMVLEKLSNRDFQQFDEKYVKLLMITLASLSQLYIIKSEAEVEREYPDLMYVYRKPYTPKYQFLLEVKYLKKKDESKLDSKMQEAKTQVMRYFEKPELRQLENLKSYAIVFVGTAPHFEECIFSVR